MREPRKKCAYLAGRADGNPRHPKQVKCSTFLLLFNNFVVFNTFCDNIFHEHMHDTRQVVIEPTSIMLTASVCVWVWVWESVEHRTCPGFNKVITILLALGHAEHHHQCSENKYCNKCGGHIVWPRQMCVRALSLKFKACN